MITQLVAVRASEHNAIALTTMPFEGEGDVVGISVESSGNRCTFHFHNVGELRAFLARAAAAADLL